MKNEKSKPAWKMPLSAEALRECRKEKRESQSQFWQRFGVSQSRGSRFELGFKPSSPVQMLIHLYLEGSVSDSDLWRVAEATR